MSEIMTREMSKDDLVTVAGLVAGIFADKREAILGRASGWQDVVQAFLSEYGGIIFVAVADGRVAGAAAIRAGEWEPGKVTTRAVLSKVGIIGGLFAKRRLSRLVASLPKLLPGEGEIDALGVGSEHRRSGIASELIESVEEWSRDQGVECLCLSVKEDNEPALALYKKMGFEVSQKYSNAWGHNLYMKKDLSKQ